MFKNIFDGPDRAKYSRKDEVVVLDADWASNTFLPRAFDLDKDDDINRYYSTANNKFTDTTLGGAIGINPKPQFTRYCDPRSLGRISKRREVTVGSMVGDFGEGEYYSENISAHQQKAFFEFGVAEFNSLPGFIANGVDSEMRIIAKTGRPATAYNFGKVVGTAAILRAFPGVTIAVALIKLGMKVLSGDSTFKYYYLKPTMHNYWATVNTLSNRMAVELKIVTPDLMKKKTIARTLGIPVEVTAESMEYLQDIMPDVVGKDNYIDIFAVATRSQRLANQQLALDREIYKKNPDAVAQDYRGFIKTKYTTSVSMNPAMGGFFGMVNELLTLSKKTGATGYNKDPNKDSEGRPVKTPEDPSVKDDIKKIENKKLERDDKTGVYTATDKDIADHKDAGAYIDAVMREGGGYAVFNVDYIGSVSESFSNSTEEIPLSGMMKSMSTKMRHLNFSTAGGNVIPGLGTVIDTVSQVALGTLDGVTMNFASAIGSVLGGGYTDMPKMYGDSTASLPSVTFKTRLVSVYGNPISQFKDMYIPLMMLLAGVLPQSAGRSAYVSPYLSSCFVKGIIKSKLGMLTSLSLTRGVSNLGFTRDGRALAIDVSFEYTPFNTVMSAPVNPGMFGGILASLDEGTAIDDYLSTLAARDLLDNKYLLPRLKRKYARVMMEVSSVTSVASWGMLAGGIVKEATGGLGGMVTSYAINMTD